MRGELHLVVGWRRSQGLCRIAFTACIALRSGLEYEREIRVSIEAEKPANDLGTVGRVEPVVQPAIFV
jgi:hypothetical protein